MQRLETLSQESAVVPTERPASKSRRPLAPVFLLGLALALFVLTGCAEAWFGKPRVVARWIGVPGFGLSTLLALAGCVSSFANLSRLQTVVGGPLGLLLNVMLGVLGIGMTWVGALTTLFATVGFARGRQLRRSGRVLLAPLAAGGGWVDATLELERPVRAPVGLGQQWRENGRTEHASVASFARLTLDLMALGAPPELVTAANQDTLDEIRHTEACFALAYALDGKVASPGVGTLGHSR
jgi:hypothetical protein